MQMEHERRRGRWVVRGEDGQREKKYGEEEEKWLVVGRIKVEHRTRE